MYAVPAMDAVPALPLLLSLPLLLLRVAAPLALLLLDELLAHVLLLAQALLGGGGAQAGVGVGAVLGHAKGKVSRETASPVGLVWGSVTARQAQAGCHLRRRQAQQQCKLDSQYGSWLAGDHEAQVVGQPRGEGGGGG